MSAIELTPTVTHDDAGLVVVEYSDDWFASDDLGYFAEYMSAE